MLLGASFVSILGSSASCVTDSERERSYEGKGGVESYLEVLLVMCE